MRRPVLKKSYIRATVVVVAVSLFSALTAAPAPARAPGVVSYSDWSWSVNGTLYDQIRGTKFHREDGRNFGISAQVRASQGVYGAILQRNLSWADDGWATIAETNSGSWVRDNKRYERYCGDWIQYRVVSWADYDDDTQYSYSSKIYTC